MADEQADVKVKLVLDSNAEKATGEFRGHLDKINADAKKTGGNVGSSLTGGIKAGAVAAGMIYAELAKLAAEKAKEVFTVPIEAFMESQKQVKALAGSFAIVDQGGNSFERLRGYANDTKDELEELGMKVGTSDDELVGLFNNIMEKGGKSVEQAKALTEQMALAGRVTQGGSSEISAGFESIQQGMIKAKNPIVGMISATGMLKGNAHQVAEQMNKMSIDKQMALAEAAVGKMAEKMRNVPMTMGQAITSLKVLGDNLFETMGEPMTKGLSKAVAHVRSMFLTSEGTATPLTEKLMAAAKFFGDFLAQAFEIGSAWIDGFVDGVGIFGDEFKVIWKEVFGESDATFKNMVEYAKIAGSIVGGFVKFMGAGLGALIIAAEKTVKWIAVTAGFILKAAGDFTGSEMLTKAGQKTMGAGFSAERGDIYKEAASVVGPGKGELQEQLKFSTDIAEDSEQANSELEAAFAERRKVQAIIDDAKAQMERNDASNFAAAFNAAADSHQEAATKNIATFIASNAAMAQTLAVKGPEIFGAGADAFIDSLKSVNPEVAKMIKEAWRPQGVGGAKPPNPIFTGPITIKQDFRDQDPDRVAIAFKDELGKAASSITSSSRGNSFGVFG